MATRRYSINPQDNDHQVTEAAGAAVVTKNIELTVDFDSLIAATPSMTGTQAKMQVLMALKKLHAHIETRGVWPPA
jgi:hypothetical protein